MSDNITKLANRLDKVRAAAIYNTKKRFAEMEAKANEAKELQEIAQGLTEERHESIKAVPDSENEKGK